jgi:hypothetical protein
MEVPAARDSVDGGRGGSWKEELEARRALISGGRGGGWKEELEARRALISGGRGGGWKEEVEFRRPLLDVREEALMDGRGSAAIAENNVFSTERIRSF